MQADQDANGNPNGIEALFNFQELAILRMELTLKGSLIDEDDEMVDDELVADNDIPGNPEDPDNPKNPNTGSGGGGDGGLQIIIEVDEAKTQKVAGSGNGEATYKVNAQICPDTEAAITDTAVSQGEAIPFCVCPLDYPINHVNGYKSLSFTGADGGRTQVSIANGETTGPDVQRKDALKGGHL